MFEDEAELLLVGHVVSLLEEETGLVLEVLKVLKRLVEETLVVEADGETVLDEEILLDEDEIWLDEVT